MANFKEDIAKTRAFIFDVDGVMTDGGIMPIEGGTDFIRKYNAKDGYAIAYAVRRGYKVCVISGGYGTLLRARLEKLGVTKIYLGCMNKIEAMEEFFREYDIAPAYTIYLGDDIPDLVCMELVGIPVCPAEACAEVLEAARFVS
ncbi:MAG: HAD hydrolase family protein, partial [Alistipes sp.]|nr:HAD hydrolase family protein [Alistipes sp.]